MKISGLVVCVNYAEHLSRSIDRWRDGLDSLTVVTSFADSATTELVSGRGTLHQSDAFYRNGAYFNKGAAISEAVDAGCVDLSDWVLFFDADIVPPEGWRKAVESQHLDPNILYGADRWEDAGGHPIHDAMPAGYFLLFHGQSEQAKQRPIVDTCWPHAGNYDSTFMMRFSHRHMMRLGLRHIGKTGWNWFGVGNEHLVREMKEERERRGGAWEHERI